MNSHPQDATPPQQPESVSPKPEELKPEGQEGVAPRVEPLSFDEYYSNPETEEDVRKRLHFRLREIAWGGWNARQSEIDASHERERVLREELALCDGVLDGDPSATDEPTHINILRLIREKREARDDAAKWKEKAEQAEGELGEAQSIIEVMREALLQAIYETVNEGPYPDGPCIPKDTRNEMKAAAKLGLKQKESI